MKSFEKLDYLEKQVEARITELKDLRERILDCPRGSMSINFEDKAPIFKNEYWEIGQYITKQTWEF